MLYPGDFSYFPDFSDPRTICFFDACQGTGGLASSYWTFGDGSHYDTGAPMSSVVHTYAAPGTYHVELVDSYGEDSWMVQKDIVVAGPQVISNPFDHGIVASGDLNPWNVATYMVSAREWRFRDSPIIAMSEATRRAVCPGRPDQAIFWALVYLGLYSEAPDVAWPSEVIWDIFVHNPFFFMGGDS